MYCSVRRKTGGCPISERIHQLKDTSLGIRRARLTGVIKSSKGGLPPFHVTVKLLHCLGWMYENPNAAADLKYAATTHITNDIDEPIERLGKVMRG